MKKIYFLLILLLIPAIILLMAFSSGAPEGHSGSPLDGQNCTACHQPGPATSIAGLITADFPTEGYTPGETYTITVTTSDLSAERYGFQITSETASEKIGSWIITNTDRTQLAGLSAVTHTFAGTAALGTSNSWVIDWIAPADGTGEVHFYVAVNKTNNSGTNEGDEIYTSMLTVQESTIGIPELRDEMFGQVYPNPAIDRININIPMNAEVIVYDNNGRTIRTASASTETLVMDISELDQGIYYLQIRFDGQSATRTFVKK